MTNEAELAARRGEIIAEMASIGTMRKGSLNEKYNNVARRDGTVSRSGPYYTLTTKGPGNRTVSLAVAAVDAGRVRAEVGNYRRFRLLADEYVSVCEGLADAALDPDSAKKN